MQKLFKSKALTVGVLLGFLAGGSWLAWGAIQSQVGGNIFDTTNGKLLWKPWSGFNAIRDSILDTTNQSNLGVPVVSVVPINSAGVVSLPCTGQTLECGSDRVVLAPMGIAPVAAATSWKGIVAGVRVSTSDPADGQPSLGFLYRGTDSTDSYGFFRLANAIRGVSATNLTQTISDGTAFNVPLSTWYVTHTPAAATQATISKAAGGAGVRHVATTITACSAQAAAAQTPIAINLRDGATGAGTIIRSWKISSTVQDSKCVDLSGLAITGTANTAMTIEFAAAGVAGSEQTVSLTGFSVQ